MVDQICIDWLSIGPELDLTFSGPADSALAPARRTACRQHIAKIAGKIFEKRFGTGFSIPVSFDDESLWIRVKPKIETLPQLLSVYVSQPETTGYLAADIRWCWAQLAPMAKKVLTSENRAIEVQQSEQVQGALERLDAISFACEKKGQWEDLDLAEAKSNLSVIYFSRNRDELVPAMNAYFETKYPGDGESHKGRQPAFDFLSGLLQEEARRRQNGLSNKIGTRSALE